MNEKFPAGTAAPEKNPAARQASPFTRESENKRPCSVTVRKPLPEISALLKKLDHFPQFFEHLEKVAETGPNQADWIFHDGQTAGGAVRVPMAVEYGNNDLTWTTTDAAGFGYAVTINLEAARPVERGTVVRLTVSYDSAFGEAAGKLEKIFAKDPETLSKINLQRLKAFCETGHVPTIEGQPSGRDEDQHSTTKH